MKRRCNNPSSSDYKHYGGRGIKVCNEWNSDYKTFSDWAKSAGYSDNLTIDRIDVNKGYCPENCRWVTRKVKSENRRCATKVELFGREYTVEEAAVLLGLKESTVRYRHSKGLPINELKTVEQLCPVTGELLNEYRTAEEAIAATGFTSIHKALQGRVVLAGGYKWRRKRIKQEDLLCS